MANSVDYSKGSPFGSPFTYRENEYLRTFHDYNAVYLRDYLLPARVPGTTIDTTAFQNAISATTANKVLIIDPGFYKIDTLLQLSANNVTVIAYGANIDLIDDGSATGRIIRITDCSNFKWFGGILTQTAATRSGVYGLLTLIRVNKATVDGLHTVGGSSCGLWSAQGKEHVYSNIYIRDSKADGLHISRGITDVTIMNTNFANTGDDAIGIVSVLNDGSTTYPQIRGVTVINIHVNGTTLGGGIALVGCTDCEVIGGNILNSQDAGIKITNDEVAGATSPSSFISISNTLVRGAPSGFRLGLAEDCVLNGVRAVNNSDSGLSLLGATRTLVTGSKFRGNTSFGVYEGSGTGNLIMTSDIRGNGTATQVSSAVFTSCVTV